MLGKCRLIVDAPLPGAMNMAIDEAMLEAAIADPSRPATLRWYRWSKPTLSLGYFQRWSDRPIGLESLPAVRRLTGGGAILHHHDLTYGLVLPASCQRGREMQQFVIDVHRIIGETFGSDARLVADSIALPDPNVINRSLPLPEPFLCFERRSQADLVMGTSKILGSAQRNRRGIILQHGSILLGASSHAPSLAGLAEQKGRVEVDLVIKHVTERLAAKWGFALEVGSLDAQEEAMSARFAESKYSSSDWNERR